jgi:SRSO17 transposase
VADPATAPHAPDVLVIDGSGDRKAGTKTAHVARHYLGSIGKLDGGIVAVTSLRADERVDCPLHVKPYTPAERLPKGKAAPDFPTEPRLAGELVDAARDAGVSVRAGVADCCDGENATFEGALVAAGLPAVVALKPSAGIRAPAANKLSLGRREIGHLGQQGGCHSSLHRVDNRHLIGAVNPSRCRR